MVITGQIVIDWYLLFEYKVFKTTINTFFPRKNILNMQQNSTLEVFDRTQLPTLFIYLF